MMITKDSVVTLQYRIYDDAGDAIETPNEPIQYLHGGYDNLFKPLEAALDGKSLGDSVRVALSTEEAFGPRLEELVVIEPLSELPEDLEIGMEIEGYLESAPDDVVIYTVVAIKDDSATLDANHPLAGKDIVFEASIKAIRPATVKEVERGRP